MIKFFAIPLAIGLGSTGVLSLLKRSKSRKLDHFQKLKGVNFFFSWLILSNVFFYIYFVLEWLLYKSIVAKANISEKIDGSAGGYITTEEIANKYVILRGILFWMFIIINTGLFISQFFLRPSTSSLSATEKTKTSLTIMLILFSIIASVISLMLLVAFSEFSISYGG